MTELVLIHWEETWTPGYSDNNQRMWDELLTFGKDEAALDSRMIQNIIQKIVVSAHVVEEMLWYLRAAHINRTYRQPKNVLQHLYPFAYNSKDFEGHKRGHWNVAILYFVTVKSFYFSILWF